MPVYKLCQEMTYEELKGWFNYFEQRPYGWRDDDRTHKLLQAQGVKEKPWKIFHTLDAIYNRPAKEGFNPSAFKASTMFHKMLKAKGGDRINYD